MKSRKGTTPWSSVASIAFVLALACPARAQDTCDVAVALADPGPLSILAYALDYPEPGARSSARRSRRLHEADHRNRRTPSGTTTSASSRTFVASQPGRQRPAGTDFLHLRDLAEGFPLSAGIRLRSDRPRLPFVRARELEDLFRESCRPR